MNIRHTRQELSTRVIKSYILYVERYHPEIQLDSVCNPLGLSRDYLMDESNWVSIEFADNFCDKLIQLTGNQKLPFLVGTYSLSEESLGLSISTFVRLMFTTSKAFQFTNTLVPHFNRLLTVESKKVKRGQYELKFNLDLSSTGLSSERLRHWAEAHCIENISGYMTQVPVFFGSPQSKVKLSDFKYENDQVSFTLNCQYRELTSFAILLERAVVVIPFAAAGLTGLCFHTSQRWILVGGAIIFLTSYGLMLSSIFKRFLRSSQYGFNNLSKLNAQYESLQASQALLSRKLRESELVGAVIQKLLDISSVALAVPAICEEIKSSNIFEKLVLFRYSPDKLLSCSASYGYSEKITEVLSNTVWNLDFAQRSDSVDLSDLFSASKVVNLETCSAEWREILCLLESELGIIVPISIGSDCFGFIWADTSSKNANLKEDIRLLGLLAHHVALGFERESSRSEQQKLIQEIANLTRNQAFENIAVQVAHDIRAPIATLAVVCNDMSSLSFEQKQMIEIVSKRIQEIANQLLSASRNRKNDAHSQRENAKSPVKFQPDLEIKPLSYLHSVIESIVLEKRLRYKKTVQIQLKSKVFEPKLSGFVQFDSIELKRILSNLIENSVEAGSTEVEVYIELGQLKFVEIRIHDRGKGIPSELLPSLGIKGQTFNKAGGTGLGLYHAKTTLESWHGKFAVSSKINFGTSIVLALPLYEKGSPILMTTNQNSLEAPIYFTSTDVNKSSDAILLDDDILVQKGWLMAARSAGKKLEIFSDPIVFMNEIKKFRLDIPIYVDSNLGNGVQGEDVAIELYHFGFLEIYLSTGYEPSKFKTISHLLRGVIGKDPPWNIPVST